MATPPGGASAFPVPAPRPKREGFPTRTLLLLAAGTFLLWVFWERCGIRGCPDVELLKGYIPEQASVILDRNGKEVTKLYRVPRTVVPLDSLPEYVPAAFIAIEDRRFWDHNGVDWRRAVGAAWANLKSLSFEQGFSTITMQLARNLFPERLPYQKRTLGRKLAEMRVAKEIEDRYEKKEILELYLNQIYFGNGAWGIEAASREYFGRPAKDLRLSMAATLAGIPKEPARLNPRANREAALERRRLVLDRMLEQGFISTKEHESASNARMRLAHMRLPQLPAAYFVDAVRAQLEPELGEALFTDGLRIYTTMDRGAQLAAEEELHKQLAAIERGAYGRFPHPSYAAVMAGKVEENGNGTAYLQGAVVVMEAETGDVLALVGGRDFSDSRYNRATRAQRQPGSAFKPFVYAAAIEAGYPPNYQLLDQPFRLVLDDGKVWQPRNWESDYAGQVTMRNALVASRNVATLRLAERVGISRVADMARQLGIEGRLPHVPSLPIGVAEVSLLELTAAYASFATLGAHPEPRLVMRVEDDDGDILYEQPTSTRRVLDPAVAFIVSDFMRDAVDRGTGTAVRAAGYYGPAAGKTGTTNDATDAWFIGFTPTIVTGVWVGMDEKKTITRRASGGRLAAPAWGRIMRRIVSGAGAGKEPGQWVVPAGVEEHWVDEWGNVLGPGCYSWGYVYREYFLAGTADVVDCGSGGWLWPDTAPPPYFEGEGEGEGEQRGFFRRMWRDLFGRERDVRVEVDTPTSRLVPPATEERREEREETIWARPPRDTLDNGTSDTLGRDTLGKPTGPWPSGPGYYSRERLRRRNEIIISPRPDTVPRDTS